uniref:Uncharacterized protein n=1 Tax=Oryza punctata TaxID=4537 RepID=A0A0E0M4R6_ORYPU
MENREICCGSCSSGYLPVDDNLFSFFSEAAAAFCLDAKDSALPPYPMLPQQKQAKLERKKVRVYLKVIQKKGKQSFDGIQQQYQAVGPKTLAERFFRYAQISQLSTTLTSDYLYNLYHATDGAEHLRPTRDNCSACIRGQSPADESNIACKQPFATAPCTSFKRPNPDLPVKRRRSMIPKEYTSERGVRSPEIAYSGSMYTKDPFGWVWRYRVVVALNSSVNIRHTPKPLSLATLFPSRRMLDAFKSLQAPG